MHDDAATTAGKPLDSKRFNKPLVAQSVHAGRRFSLEFKKKMYTIQMFTVLTDVRARTNSIMLHGVATPFRLCLLTLLTLPCCVLVRPHTQQSCLHGKDYDRLPLDVCRGYPSADFSPVSSSLARQSFVCSLLVAHMTSKVEGVITAPCSTFLVAEDTSRQDRSSRTGSEANRVVGCVEVNWSGMANCGVKRPGVDAFFGMLSVKREHTRRGIGKLLVASAGAIIAGYCTLRIFFGTHALYSDVTTAVFVTMQQRRTAHRAGQIHSSRVRMSERRKGSSTFCGVLLRAIATTSPDYRRIIASLCCNFVELRCTIIACLAKLGNHASCIGTPSTFFSSPCDGVTLVVAGTGTKFTDAEASSCERLRQNAPFNDERSGQFSCPTRHRMLSRLALVYAFQFFVFFFWRSLLNAVVLASRSPLLHVVILAEQRCREELGREYIMEITVVDRRPDLFKWYQAQGYVMGAMTPFPAPEVIREGYKVMLQLMTKRIP